MSAIKSIIIKFCSLFHRHKQETTYKSVLPIDKKPTDEEINLAWKKWTDNLPDTYIK